MLYHFNTRSLSFLKTPTLLRVLESLADHPTARAACLAARIPEPDVPLYQRALATLASSQMIVPGVPPEPRRTAQPVYPPAFGTTAGGETGPAGSRPTPLTERFEARPDLTNLPNLGTHLRLQPGVHPLPVQLRP